MDKNKNRRKMVSPSTTSIPCNEKTQSSVSMSIRWKFSIGFLLSGMIFNGCIYGFPNATSYSLKTESGLDDEDLSWVSSISNLGVPFGSLLSGFIMNLIGRKPTTLIFLGGSYIISRICLITASLIDNSREEAVFYLIVLGRFIAGICQGFCNCLLVLYALELCRTQKQKNATGAISALFGYSATLLSYLAGALVNWKILGAIQSLWAIPFLLGIMFFVPESPTYYILKGRESEAIDSMVKLFGSDAKYIMDACEISKSDFKDLFTSSGIKNLLLGTGMMFFYQFAGYTVVNNNINEILASGNLISIDDFRPENIASIVVSGAGLLGVLLGFYLSIKKSNIRGKWLIIASGIFSGLAFFVIGGANYYRLHVKEDATSYLYVGTSALVAHILFFSAGYGTICLPIIASSQSSSVRPIAMSIIMTLGGGFAFLNAKSYYDMTELLGGRMDLSFFIYGVINLLGALYMGCTIKNDY